MNQDTLVVFSIPYVEELIHRARLKSYHAKGDLQLLEDQAKENISENEEEDLVKV